jgi:hypothetical protein
MASTAVEIEPLAEPRGVGRPPIYTSELAESICKLITAGRSLRKACIELNISIATVREWVVTDHHGFSAQYSRAREAQLEHWADEIADIADDCRRGVVVTEETDKKGKIVSRKTVESDAVERSKLQVTSRMWLLSKLAPKKYGDRLAVSGSGDVSLTAFIIQGGQEDPKPIKDVTPAAIETAAIQVPK